MSDQAAAVGTGMDVLAASLTRNGVSRIFGLMGDANLDWLSRWALTEPNHYVAARHECGAVSMADGYSMESGEIGYSTVTYGPGLLNAMNGICTAVRGRNPQILILGTTPRSAPFHLQKYDHRSLVAAAGALYLEVDAPDTIESSLRRAQALALQHRTTVVLDYSAECLLAPATHQVEAFVPSAASPRSGRSVAIETASALLAAASRPLIVGGLGAERAGAVPELQQLADRTGAMLASSLITRGLFAGDPRYVGVMGGFATDRGRPVIEHADLVIAFGASLNLYTTEHGELLRGKTVIQVDDDQSALGRQHPIDLGVHGDAKLVAAELCARAAAPSSTAKPGWCELGADVTYDVQFDDQGDGDGLDPRFALTAIDRWLPERRVIMSDGGHFEEWPSRYLRVSGPGSFRTALAGGSIGLSIPMAIGMATCQKADAYVAVIGDGGFYLSLADVESAARERIPIIVLVLDDAAYSAEVHKLRALGIPEDKALFPGAADIADVARALGAEALRIETAADLDRLPPLGSLDGPLVVDVAVSRAVLSSRLSKERLTRTNQFALPT